MKKLLSFVFIFFNFSLFSCSFNLASQNYEQIKVLKITDGDTIEILNKDNQKEIIRLYGVDTPETLKPRYNDEQLAKYEDQYAKLAKRKLITKIQNNSKIYIQRITKDTYKRTVALVYYNEPFNYSSNSLINSWLIYEGLARVAFIQAESPKKAFYTQTKDQFEYYKTILEIEKVASSKQKGFWKHPISQVFYKKLT
ncbi:thermonuclease family protein [Mycoplasmopsis bovirhinis]|uniref:Thermonuclease n=1 Tax=Mycoplasmopsis bovirhinis TaxID=29553 RepID=A0A449ACW6_9BACT|nr:thermonuclease family protein [Mycoplasmopsis bovirhinis]VEU62891.1 Thermonuclease precursor [Mycoplasmopsis bovirhinis]